MTVNFSPLRDRVLIRKLEESDTTASGILIPQSAKEKPSMGVVEAIGPGGHDNNGNIISMTLKIGDKVYFGKWSGTDIKIDRVEYSIMKESDIFGICSNN